MTTTDNPEGRRQVLAAIALSALPMPQNISFNEDGDPLLSLAFDGLDDGEEWARALGGHLPARVGNGRRWLDQECIRWRGWSVLLHASEPTADGGSDLDAETCAALAVVIEQHQGHPFATSRRRSAGR